MKCGVLGDGELCTCGCLKCGCEGWRVSVHYEGVGSVGVRGWKVSLCEW